MLKSLRIFLFFSTFFAALSAADISFTYKLDLYDRQQYENISACASSAPCFSEFLVSRFVPPVFSETGNVALLSNQEANSVYLESTDMKLIPVMNGDRLSSQTSSYNLRLAGNFAPAAIPLNSTVSVVVELKPSNMTASSHRVFANVQGTPVPCYQPQFCTFDVFTTDIAFVEIFISLIGSTPLNLTGADFLVPFSIRIENIRKDHRGISLENDAQTKHFVVKKDTYIDFDVTKPANFSAFSTVRMPALGSLQETNSVHMDTLSFRYMPSSLVEVSPGSDLNSAPLDYFVFGWIDERTSQLAPASISTMQFHIVAKDSSAQTAPIEASKLFSGSKGLDLVFYIWVIGSLLLGLIIGFLFRDRLLLRKSRREINPNFATSKSKQVGGVQDIPVVLNLDERDRQWTRESDLYEYPPLAKFEDGTVHHCDTTTAENSIRSSRHS